MRLKIILVIIVVTIILGGVAFWFWQQNPFSTGSLRLEILSPSEVTMGEEITYVVRWKNNGEAELESVTLIFEYPEGSLPSEDESLRITKTLEDINPGQEGSLKFPARLFGKNGELKEAKVFLTYTPRNLNASFRSETTAIAIISFVPLNFELDIPSRIESGQQLDLLLNYFSNSEYPLSNLRIQIEYPTGFDFLSGDPAPIGENEWNVGVLNRTEGGRIVIQGILEGEVDEVKIFEATLGSWNEGEFILLKEVTKAVQITKTKLLVSQVVNSTADYVAASGDTLHYEIFFKNLGDKVLENLFLVVTLDGRAFDLNSLKIDRGKFQQGDNSVIWESRDVSKLRFLGRGEEGKVEFWINVKEQVEIFSPQDNELVLKDRVLISETKEDFEIKLQADLTIAQTGFFQDEVFGNQGPMPPKAGSRTTYTVIWLVNNSYNDVQNAKVKAILPLGVELTGKIFPQDASLTFDPVLREVVWQIGDLAAGTGAFDALPPPSVAFQIAFTPTQIHRGTTPQIIEEARITGDDLFTEQIVSSSDEPIDTNLPDDPTVIKGTGVVQ